MSLVDQGSGCIKNTDRTFQLVNGGVQLYFGVEKATCFKWLQHGDPLRSPVDGNIILGCIH